MLVTLNVAVATFVTTVEPLINSYNREEALGCGDLHYKGQPTGANECASNIYRITRGSSKEPLISYRCDLIKGLVCTSHQIQHTKNPISWLVSVVISTGSARTTYYFVTRTQWPLMTRNSVMNGETKRTVPTQWVLILVWRIQIGKDGLRKVKMQCYES